jgi:diguanylate cyclase (GGDEF)-like protein/PAS domain S-box-containing protein
MTQITSEKLLDNLFDGVYFVDTNRTITYWNAAAERITGYLKGEVIGKCCADNLLRHIDQLGNELCHRGCPLSDSILDGKMREATVFLHHKSGHRIPVSIRVSPVRDDDGTIIGAVEIFTDNSSTLQIMKDFEELKQEVYRDALTNIANRKYAEMVLSTRVYGLREHNALFGVLFLDVDHFKLFNDTHGHNAGDDVLVMVAQSIANSLRKIDVVARWGGEEFVVVLPGATRVVVGAIAERIRMLIANSFIMAGDQKFQVTVSIGGAISNSEDSALSIVKRADDLMYLSKQNGRNRVTMDAGS